MDETSLAGLNIDWNKILEMLQTSGVDFGINLVTAIAIFYIGRMVVRLVTRAMRKLMNAREVDPILITFISNLVNMILLVVLIVAAVGALGVPTASFVAMIGAAGLAVGLALQGSLSNFAAGVLIVLFRPYKVGDWIEAAGVAGSVEGVQILTTILKTGDNKKIVVPNGQIMGSVITNFSANETRRIDLDIGVGYDDDLDKTRKTLEDIIAADDRILEEPAPKIAVSALGDSAVNFVVRPWVNTPDYWSVRFDLVEAIKKRFDQEGISFPYPQQDVHLHKVD